MFCKRAKIIKSAWKIFVIAGLTIAALTDGNLVLAESETETPNGYEEEWQEVPYRSTERYAVTEYGAEITGIERPAGLCAAGDSLYVCDAEQDRIMQYDLEMNLVKSYGRSGKGESEFSQPLDLVCSSDRLYVLDAGNNRIQIFDLELNYQETIVLPELPDFQGEARYRHMAVDQEGSIYLTTDSMVEDYNKLYVWKNGGMHLSAQSIIGPLVQGQDGIYAADMLEYHVYEDSAEAGSGYNNLYRVTDEELELVRQLPVKYVPVAGYAGADGICLISATQGISACFSLADDSTEALFRIPDIMLEAYACCDAEDGVYVSDGVNGRIQHFQKEKK